MKISTKSTFIILGTLVIGIIIGILGGGILHQKRFERFEKIRRMNPEQRFTEVIDEIIKPDENQRNLIKDILKKQAEKIAQLDEEYQGKIFSIFDSTKQQINSSLSKEQINRMEAHIAKGRDHFLKGHIDRLDQMLELTDEQREKIEEILSQFNPPLKANKRFPFDKLGNGVQQFKNQFEEMDKKMESVLTPEQVEKYKQFRARRGPRPGGFPPHH